MGTDGEAGDGDGHGFGRIDPCVAFHVVVDHGDEGDEGKGQKQHGCIPDELKKQVYARPVHLEVVDAHK